MSALPAPGSMAAHIALVAAVDNLLNHALNCGMPPECGDPLHWTARRAATWLSLCGGGTAALASRFNCSQPQPGGAPMITPENASFAASPSREREGPHDLILSSRVTGTPIYNRAGEHIGHVSDLSIDKVSGRALYALIAFGGFLGVGERLHPMPWGALTYDPDKNGFSVSLTKDELKAAPSLSAAELEDLGGGDEWRTRMDAYYSTYGYPLA